MNKKVLAVIWWILFIVGCLNTLYLVGLFVVTLSNFGNPAMIDGLIGRYAIVIVVFTIALGLDRLIRRAGFNPAPPVKVKP